MQPQTNATFCAAPHLKNHELSEANGNGMMLDYFVIFLRNYTALSAPLLTVFHFR